MFNPSNQSTCRSSLSASAIIDELSHGRLLRGERSMRKTMVMLLSALAALSSHAADDVPAWYITAYGPAYADIVAAANQEGRVVVYSVTSAVPALLEDFQKLYPRVKLEYHALDTTPLYERILAESAAGVTADVAWSSAMDLQIKLVNDGYAQPYVSPEAAKLPAWAIWRNEAFGTTSEPVGFVYNKRLLAANEVPRNRAELIALLKSQPHRFLNKAVTFDPEKSGLGYLLMTQDMVVSQAGFSELANALGAAKMRLGTGSGVMFGLLGSGESLIGYNLLGSYAAGRAKKDLPELGVILPNDYTLLMSRIMFITKKAPHPNAAKLWVDYVLSKRGQEILVKSDLGSIRTDIDGEMTLAGLTKRLGDALKPIPIGLGLLTYLDPKKRTEFISQWKSFLGTANK